MCGVEELSPTVGVYEYDDAHVLDSSKPDDILSSHWRYQNVWNMLMPILFWHGSTEEFDRMVGECQLSRIQRTLTGYLVRIRCTLTGYLPT